MTEANMFYVNVYHLFLTLNRSVDMMTEVLLHKMSKDEVLFYTKSFNSVKEIMERQEYIYD